MNIERILTFGAWMAAVAIIIVYVIAPDMVAPRTSSTGVSAGAASPGIETVPNLELPAPTVIGVLPDVIDDRQMLAEYQAALPDILAASRADSLAADIGAARPDIIGNRQMLIQYQAIMLDNLAASQSDMREASTIGRLPDAIDDRSMLAEDEATLP